MTLSVSTALLDDPSDPRAELVRRATDHAKRTGAIAMCVAPRALAPSGPPSVEWCGPGVRARGWGEAWSVDLRGPDRLTQLRAALASLWSRLEVIGDPAPLAPRVFGGLAFTPGAADAPPWTGFGDGRFVLPRWLELTVGSDVHTAYVSRSGGAASGASPDAEGSEASRGVPARAKRGAGERGVPPLGGHRGAVAPLSQLASYIDTVARLRADIARRAVDKVVLARRERVRLPATLAPEDVVARLARSFPDCTTFAFEAGGATFVGATPERLFTKQGSRASTEALAGSIDASLAGAAARLVGDAKERAEHAFVVHDIARRMTPLCETLDVAPNPAVRALPHVLHLRTPIEGLLRPGVSAVDLIEALHPTPAVGGVPAEAALERIAALEHDARGWYSAPIGWIDARGDAELCVALRSGVLAGDSAFLFAGAGIVEGSSAEAEWAETELKMRALATALGAAP